MTTYSIGEFSKKTGLSIDTLRYYEKEKLIYPKRKANHQRYYDERDLDWIEAIIRLKATGMSLQNIKIYADLREKGDETIFQRVVLLFAQLDELHQKQMVLNQNIDFLEQKIKTYLGIKSS